MTTKICKKCGVEKEVSNFSKQTKSADGYYSWCKECAKEYRYKRYYDNIEESRRKTNKKRAERVIWLRSLKEGIPCKDCGKFYDPSCMDYDHVCDTSEKIKNVSRMVLDNSSKESILEEIKKCELVCLFCHNKRTHDRFSNTKYPPNVLRNIKIINDFKNVECIICGQKYEHYNMQLDHIDPSTRLNYVCNLKSCKEEILREELSKCRVLCAMCHRKKSLIEQKLGKYSPREKTVRQKKPFCDFDSRMKECTVCGEIKGFDEFYKQAKAKCGLTPACRDCLNLAKKKKRGTLDKVLLAEEGKKKCSKCQEVKEFSEFNQRTDGGLSPWCKSCYNEYRRSLRKSS